MERLEEIRARAGRLAVFLDYDGTLTPIVARPELATLDDDARRVLGDLAGKTTVAVISGRDLRDVRSLVGIDGLFYAGSHGFEIEGPGEWRLDFKDAEAFLPDLDAAEADVRGRVAGIPGTLVERKKFSLAIHYRLVEPSKVQALEVAVGETAAGFPRLRRAAGKKVYELQPALDWDKGKAVLWLLSALDLHPPETLPLFIGDDLTDEDAFRALKGTGAGVIVRDVPRPTAADYALDGPREVVEFLKALAAW
ncbi:MAG: trehalose-phosphatase [Bryobacteraceae bacterium]|nr:trehalose-phosphatase [Bryobacteraceae bacterium]